MGLVGGQIPFDGELILSLTRLDKIREIDAASNTMTCEAGVVLAKAQDAATAADRLFPLSLRSGPKAVAPSAEIFPPMPAAPAQSPYGIARDLVR